MSKLYDRHDAREDRLPDTLEALPELPPDVTVPDDVSAITHPETKIARPATGIRWMRWSALALLLVAGAVVAALVVRGDTTETEIADTTPWTVAEVGPGSNSLAPNLVPGETNPWTYPTEGPGSHSLAASSVTRSAPWTYPAAGPGSHTMAPTWAPTDAVPWTYPAEGPGSNTLAP